MRPTSWRKKIGSIVMIVSLVLPTVVHAQPGSTQPIQAFPDGPHQVVDTKKWLSAYKESMEAASKQKAKKPEEVPAYTKDDVAKMEWDSFQVEDVWEMYQSCERKTLQLIAYFYPLFDRFLSHNEQVEKYAWTDEEVIGRLGQLSDAQYNQLAKYAPAIDTFYKQSQLQKEPQNLQSKLAADATSSTLPDAMYDPNELTFPYKRPNTDNPVDELYRAAHVKEMDLHLDGKHGMDVTLEREYSSLDSAEDRPYYSSGGDNKVVSNFDYAVDNHMSWGWKLNFPSFVEIGERQSKCTYYPEQSRSGCGLYFTGKKRYIFMLEDGTVLESSSTQGDWVNYPYDGASMLNYGKGSYVDNRKDIVTLKYNGYTYTFSTEINGADDSLDTDIVTKTNEYGDKVVYRIAKDEEKPIEILDSVGRYIVLEKGRYNIIRHLKVYTDATKTTLLKHLEYVESDWDQQLDKVIEHDVRDAGLTKTIAEYAYHRSDLYGQAEFNLKSGYSMPATEQGIILDYQGMESSAYLTDDTKERGTMAYRLLHQVKYPVEGLTMTYTYNPYQPDQAHFLSRGVIRQYYDEEKLTYTTYHPVTAVNFRFAKTPNPEDPKTEYYSYTRYYPLTANEIWKKGKEASSRLKNQSVRDGSVIVSQTIQEGLPSQEHTFFLNPDHTFLPRSVKTYIGSGDDTDTIQGQLTLSEDGKEYRYAPVSYTSYLYQDRETKPRYAFSFWGGPPR